MPRRFTVDIFTDETGGIKAHFDFGKSKEQVAAASYEENVVADMIQKGFADALATCPIRPDGVGTSSKGIEEADKNADLAREKSRSIGRN